jgi:DNA-binding CsgD family transcriptional regulator
MTLAPIVAALRGPLGRLNETEGEIAQLLSYGLSTQEIARAIQVNEETAQALVDGVTRRLKSFSAGEFLLPVGEIRPRRRALRL